MFMFMLMLASLVRTMLFLRLWLRRYRMFSHYVTAAMLVSQTNPVEVELFSYVDAFFCKNLHICWPREWKRSIGEQGLWDPTARRQRERCLKSEEVEFKGILSKFRKRSKVSSLFIYVLHKTQKLGVLHRSRAKTANKCTKKYDARVLLFKPVVFFWRSRCGRAYGS